MSGTNKNLNEKTSDTIKNEGIKKSRKNVPAKKNITQKNRNNNEVSILMARMPQQKNNESSGIYAMIDFNDKTTWKTQHFKKLVDCVDNLNTCFSILLEKNSNVSVKSLSIVICHGVSFVTDNLKTEFESGGIYNTCSTNKLLELNIGNPNVVINEFQIVGGGGSHVIGSCKFNIINLCALETDERDENKKVKKYPQVTLQNFIWSGALWIDFIYTNLTGVEVNENNWGMKEYTVNGVRKYIAPSSKDYDWVMKNTVDMIFMSNVVIKMPSPMPLEFPKNISRVQPLFYLNSFSVVRHQTWNCSVYSYVGPTTDGPQIPLVLYNHNFAPATAHPDFLFNSIKFSAEIYGKYLPICLQINNSSKCGILSSSLSGKTIIETKALAISGTYLLAVGTENGEPLTEENPVCKVLEFINGPNTSNEVQVRPGGIIAPCRFVMDGNSIVTSVVKNIDQSLYTSHKSSVKYLPWVILNSKGLEDSNMPKPISKFSCTMFWFLFAPFKQGQITGTSASGAKVEDYGAVTLTNFVPINVNIDYEKEDNEKLNNLKEQESDNSKDDLLDKTKDDINNLDLNNLDIKNLDIQSLDNNKN